MKYEITIKPIDEEAKNSGDCCPEKPIIADRFMLLARDAENKDADTGAMCGSIEDIALLLSKSRAALIGAARVGVAISDAVSACDRENDPVQKLLDILS